MYKGHMFVFMYVDLNLCNIRGSKLYCQHLLVVFNQQGHPVFGGVDGLQR